MASDKPIVTLNALVALGVDEASAARVVREISKTSSAIQKRLDQLNATKAQKSMDIWAKAVKEAGGVSKLTEDQTRRLADQVERLAKAGAKVPIALQPAIDSVNKLRAAEKSAADSAELKSGLLNKAGMGSLAGAGPAAGAFLAVGAMAGVAKETFDLINSTADLADNVSDLAATYQISTDAVQQFQFMADRAGLTIDDFGSAIVNLTKNLDKNPEMFKRWGMDIEHLKSLKPDELLGAMAEKLETLNDSDRLTFSKELMKGTALLPVLLDGFDQLAAKAKELGINLSEADISSLQDLREDIDDIGTAWAGMWVELGAALAQDQDVQEFFDVLREGIVELAAIIKDNKSEIVGFAKILAGMATLNPVLIAKGVKGMVDSAEREARMAATLAHEQGLMGSGVGVEFGVQGRGSRRPGQHLADPVSTRAAAADAERALKAQEQLAVEYSRFLTESAQLDAAAAAATAKAIAGIQVKVQERITDALLQKGPLSASGSGAGKKLLADVNRKAAEDWMFENNQLTGMFDFREPPSPDAVKKVKVSWSEFLEDAANQFQLMGASGAAMAKIIGGVGGIGAMFKEGGALQGVSGIKSLFKGGTGGDVLKSLTGGLSAAFAAIDVGKMIFSLFHKSEAQKVAFDVGRDYGVQISEGLSKEIAEKSKTMGRDAASLLSLDKIIGEAGGVQAFGLDKTISKMHDLFSMIQTGKMTVEQAKAPFDQLFGEVAQASISKTTGLISTQVRELMALNAASGMQSDAVAKFRDEQRSIADTILNRLADNKDFKIANEQAGAALGATFAAQYRRMIEQGLSGTEIAEKLGGLIEKLQAKFHESGFGGGAAFEETLAKLAIFQDELTGPTAQSIQDVTALAAALYNSGDLTRDQFAGLAGQIGTDFTHLQQQLESQGRAPEEAFALMAGDLQKLWEMQRRYGVTLDEQTQSILTQAEAAGSVGEERMSAEDRMAEGIERLSDIMQRTGEALGASFDDLPQRARTAASGVNAALAGIAAPGLNLSRDMGPYTSAGAGGLEAALGDLASGAVGEATAEATGEAVTAGLSPELRALGDSIIAAMLGMPQPVLVLDTGQLVGGVADRIERAGVARDRINTALKL